MNLYESIQKHMSYLCQSLKTWIFSPCITHQTPGWLNDNRESIVEKLGTNSVSLVAKEAGQQWKKLSAAKKKPYEAAARRLLIPTSSNGYF